MAYELALGDRAYSGWSLPGWLLFERFGIPFTAHHAQLGSAGFAAMMAGFHPARTVPAVRFPDVTIADSLAIAEELATRHPQAGHWPGDPAARATARSFAAEMHSGFLPLRRGCPLNLRVSYSECAVDETVSANLRRLEQMWDHARATFGGDGPWLFGDYCVADAYFAHAAARIATYSLDVSAAAQDYVAAHLADPAFRRYRAMALVDGPDRPEFFRDTPRRDWPGPLPLPARATDHGVAENAACPFSGESPVYLMETNGRVFGFGYAFDRDKTAADPEAWPEFMKMLA